VLTPKIAFFPVEDAVQDVLVVFIGPDRALPGFLQRFSPELSERIVSVLTSESFKGKAGSAISLLAETGIGEKPVHLILAGAGAPDDAKPRDFLRLGGQIFEKIPKNREASIALDFPGAAPISAQEAADFALGIRLNAYRFERYQTKKKPDEVEARQITISLLVEDPALARKAMKISDSVHDGVVLARDLVNEPPNILTPTEFASRAAALEKIGVEVEILDEKALKKLGMRALLAVGQGSSQESKVVILRWMGARDEKAAPIAFIGKGVVFDTGGISIKPASGMEDMKGDMAGAAAVVGLMHTLAARKARANVIGAIGLVENMPDGNAQRPGDIVTSMSGQTIEIINTDAEGRLVLADLLWHVKQNYNPVFMVNLATLTGAIMVALGQEHAGLFSNHDELASRLVAAGQDTGEKLWRMPLGAEYDKQIDSKFADMKNTGGRFGGSITAAQFLQRYVDGCPWAHLDIAGTAMSSPANDINKSWGSGFGVRLLDRLVSAHYES
jgi:leucyl aminopeptidase